MSRIYLYQKYNGQNSEAAIDRKLEFWSTTEWYDTRRMVEQYGFASQILAASIRHVMHLNESVLAGVDVATVPPIENGRRRVPTASGLGLDNVTF